VDINFFSCMDIRKYFYLLCKYLQTNPSNTERPLLHNTPQRNDGSYTFSFPTVELFKSARNTDITKKNDIFGYW